MGVVIIRKFSFYSNEDYDAGIYLNTRRSQNTNTSPYNITALELDAQPSPNTSVYFYTQPEPAPAPWVDVAGRDYETTTPYAVYTIPASQTLGAYDIDIIYDVGLSNAFAKQYIDTQNLPNVNTYYPADGSGVFVRSRLPLKGTIGQNITLYHSGFTDKNAQNAIGPINFVGNSVGPHVSLTPSPGTPILQDNWTVTAGATHWTLTRGSTATITPYGYNTQFKDVIPGFTIFVNNSGIITNDAASIATYPSKLDLMFYTLYTALAPTGRWITPILDAQDDNNYWMFCKYQHENQSTSTYLENFKAGPTPSPDSTWVTYVPPTISVNDFNATRNTPAYRQSVASLGNLGGRYGQGQFTISSYTDFLQAVDFYSWNPLTDPVMRLQGPVVHGPNMQQFMAAFAIALTDWQIKYEEFLNSFAISTAQREYLFQQGQLLNTPIHINETLEEYRTRLQIVAQGLTQAGTLSYMQQAVQSYVNDTSAFVKELAHSNLTWQLGSSLIGQSTYLGNAGFNIWAYEVHVPGAGNYDPDGLEKFVHYLNPIGAIPIFIYE